MELHKRTLPDGVTSYRVCPHNPPCTRWTPPDEIHRCGITVHVDKMKVVKAKEMKSYIVTFDFYGWFDFRNSVHSVRVKAYSPEEAREKAAERMIKRHPSLGILLGDDAISAKEINDEHAQSKKD